MNEQQWMAEQFEANRPRLRAVAYRILGSSADAEDAVQETWLRLSRTDEKLIQNMRAWLTTVVSRICLDVLRSRSSSRQKEAVDFSEGDDTFTAAADEPGPEQEAILADSLEIALFVVLEQLNPAERVAFVLHDMFDTPFEEIAPMIGKSAAAARQLASRARRRVRSATAEKKPDSSGQREIVRAFLAAAKNGDIPTLLALLDPEIVVRADDAAVKLGATPGQRGAETVAATFSGRARGAQLAVVGGAPGLVWAPGGKPRVAFQFTIADGRIAAINLSANPEELEKLAILFAD